MKKALSLFLALVMCLSLCACGGTSSTPETTTPPSARDQLTDLEKTLFNNLITMTKDNFFEPSAVRVLEVCDYDTRTVGTGMWYGPDTVVVRLQGENKVGGTLNHYYLVCVKSAENKDEKVQEWIKVYEKYGPKEERMKYKATEGEYVELDDAYTPTETCGSWLFNVSRINNALKEYWQEMGF